MPSLEAQWAVVRLADQRGGRALALDASLFEAHVTLGFIQAIHQYDWAGAENHFQCALDLNRDDPRAHLFYAGTVLSAMGRLREADFHQQRGAELDPMSPVVIGGWGADWLFQRQYDNAISACQRSLESDPIYPWALRWLGEAYLLKGMYQEAVSTLNKIGTPVFGCSLLGWSYLKAGCRDRATQLLVDLEKQASPALACQRAILNLAFEHEEETVKQLWQACVGRNERRCSLVEGRSNLGPTPTQSPISGNTPSNEPVMGVAQLSIDNPE